MLLYEYTNILLRLPGHADLFKSLDRLDEIHLLMWKQTVTLAQEDIDSELFDDLNTRMSAEHDRKWLSTYAGEFIKSHPDLFSE